jgi:hypothetical protein
MTLEIAAVDGAGWQATNVSVELGLPLNETAARVTIAQLRLASLPQPLKDIRIDCPDLELSGVRIACPKAKLVAEWPRLGRQSLAANIVYGRNDGSLDIALDGLRVGKGRAGLKASLHDDGWTATTDLKSVPIELLLQLAKDLKLPLPPSSASGLVTAAVSARGSGTEVKEATVDGALSELTANNESGSLASDKLSLRLRGSVRGSPQEWLYSLNLQSDRGQAFAQPIFLDLSAHALSLSAQGRFRGGTDLTIEQFTLDHGGVAKGTGSARVRLDEQQPVRSLALDLTSLQFPGAYETYFQPLLLDTSFKAMRTAGRISGQIAVEEGEPRRIDLKFDDVTVDDGAANLALTQLQGDWHWQADVAADASNGSDSDPPRAQTSQLQWRGGSLFGLELGGTQLRFMTRGRQVRLLEPARIPLLDGAIELETFRVRNAGMPSVAFMVDATLRPISVQRLSRAFGWPEFGGSIGGTISKLRMREDTVTLGTTLHAQVFDGEVTISDLRLEQPFGQWPRLYSNIALDNLDLQLVTSAFSFGRITGRLSGSIAGLQLFNWTPVAFDARLHTPPNDRSRHRISQRAVENIGSIGGSSAGVTAALSSGFLRFFDDFNYDRLGLSCRLENEVCVMDGVAPAPNGGYYLVKGKGLPRIDVLGTARRVDWTRLVQQLIAVTESEGPVVD